MGAATDQALSRLLNQFSEQPNIRALLTDIFARVEDSNDILDDLLNLRDIDTATGVWLDILGDIVGIERPEKEISADFIFAFKQNPADPDDPDKAFYNPSGTPTGGYYQSFEGLKDPSGDLMIDSEYRKLVKAKAIGNHVIGNIEDITRFILEGFGVSSHVTDDNPGEIEVELVSGLTQGERRSVEEYAPRAAGVNITIVNWP
jgi:hypothetical protein